ncbi:hypothetical protein [Kitasatospora cathayae]|uniref:Uncharacterized protein n=1 Tax=Kitasatospora cathayae TaxID=3004092 RepID=A0ABY7PYT7_9ACTN|nr:hypothetical protein [Kitasatospora sp. HUAS 3-15]WBP85623.1 hypothetical protein O1G21_07000 [Kitasatospora sp. HUAS 3-15]
MVDRATVTGSCGEADRQVLARGHFVQAAHRLEDHQQPMPHLAPLPCGDANPESN